MGFLKFLEKKPKKAKSQPSFESNNFRYNNTPKNQNLNYDSLPPLPILYPDSDFTKVPSELEDPFEKKYDDLNKNKDLDNDFESLPPLPSLDRVKEKKSINNISIPNKINEIEDHKEVVSTHNDKFEFPDISEAPDFEEEVNEKIERGYNKKEGPLFVNISGFKEILKDINDIKKDFREGSEILDSILEMKDRQDHRFIKWSEELQEVESKLMYIDKKLFETKYY